MPALTGAQGSSGGAPTKQDRGPRDGVGGRGDRSKKNGGREKPPERPGAAALAAKKEKQEQEEKQKGEEMVVEVQARVCRSILSADITELQFLEACPGASYVKEFSVWNK